MNDGVLIPRHRHSGQTESMTGLILAALARGDRCVVVTRDPVVWTSIRQDYPDLLRIVTHAEAADLPWDGPIGPQMILDDEIGQVWVKTIDDLHGPAVGPRDGSGRFVPYGQALIFVPIYPYSNVGVLDEGESSPKNRRDRRQAAAKSAGKGRKNRQSTPVHNWQSPGGLKR